MKKAYAVFISVAVAVVGCLALLWMLNGLWKFKSVDDSKTATRPLESCLSDDPQLAVDAADRANIEMAAASELTHIPAGTHTDVRVATYDTSQATGAEIYSGGHGTYNFTAERIPGASGDQISWKITSFTSCKL